ncbi:AAA family ATPase [Candidatus Uhrbacteria bacterium]|nr:AAA family ATPase [Candidatus Uhrbacteria bacterium]
MSNGLKGLPNFVAIEGVDGVGKTTIAQKMVENYGYVYRYTLPEPFGKIRKAVDDLGHPDARFFYYLSCVIGFQRELLSLLVSGERVVVDRYIYSTFVMHEAMGASVNCVDMASLPIVFPDKTILLSCSSEVRNSRILMRGKESQDYIQSKSNEFDRASRYFYEISNQMSVVETTDMNSDEVYRAVSGILIQKGGKDVGHI